MTDTTFKQGRSGNPGGRPRGSKNRFPHKLKQAFMDAAEHAGEGRGLVGYLSDMARAEPAAFLAQLGKILPHELKMDGQVTGEFVHKVTRTVVDPQPRNPDA